MKLKEWIMKTKKKMKSNDMMFIMYKKSLGIREPLNFEIYKLDLKKHPILLEADVIEEKLEEREYMNFTMSFQCTGQGKCMHYYCWIDRNQVEIAFHTK